MKTTVVTKESFKVIGLELRTSFKDGQNKTEIPLFFHQVLEEGKLDAVPNRVNQNQLCIFKFEKDSPDFSYIMGVEVSSLAELLDGMTGVELPAGQYAMATIIKRGAEDVGRAFGYINEEWLPQSDFVRGNSLPFIYYDDRFFSIFNKQGYAGSPLADVYFPVQAR